MESYVTGSPGWGSVLLSLCPQHQIECLAHSSYSVNLSRRNMEMTSCPRVGVEGGYWVSIKVGFDCWEKLLVTSFEMPKLKKKERKKRKRERERKSHFFIRDFNLTTVPARKCSLILQPKTVSSCSILSACREQLVTILFVPTLHILENQQWFAPYSSLQAE